MQKIQVIQLDHQHAPRESLVNCLM